MIQRVKEYRKEVEEYKRWHANQLKKNLNIIQTILANMANIVFWILQGFVLFEGINILKSNDE